MCNVKIYICCHQPGEIPACPVLEPIQVGRAVSDCKLQMRGDDTGYNISAYNRHYCELTALYWLWQNPSPDYYGICHYRRFFNFADDTTRCLGFDNFSRRYRCNSRRIKSLLTEYDVILPKPQPPARPGLSLYQRYCEVHVGSDLDRAVEIIGRLHPQMRRLAREVLHGQCSGYYKNMMIAPRAFWDDYCRWLFGILFQLHAEIYPDVLKRDSYQQRVYGFLAERLSNVYIEYRRRFGLRVCELPLLFYQPPAEDASDYLWAENI